MFNRNEMFMWGKKKKNPNMPANPRLSRKDIEHFQKDDLLVIRKQELQKKALERKKRLDRDNFLKTNRDQIITNVCSILFKHIEAAQNYIEEPTQAALLFHE